MEEGWNKDNNHNAPGDFFVLSLAFVLKRIKYLKVADNHVIKYIPAAEYQEVRKTAVQPRKKFACLLIGAESADPQYLTKEYCGLFKDSGVMPKKVLARFLINESAFIPPGTPINASHFRVGDYVDVRGKTLVFCMPLIAIICD